MFSVEIAVFFLFLGGYCVWLLVSGRILLWRSAREARRVSLAVDALPGQPIAGVLERFGPPREQFAGSSGRSLYVWSHPPSAGLPASGGVLVVTLTVDANGRIAEAAWHKR